MILNYDILCHNILHKSERGGGSFSFFWKGELFSIFRMGRGSLSYIIFTFNEKGDHFLFLVGGSFSKGDHFHGFPTQCSKK